MSEFDKLIKPYTRQLENWVNKKMGNEIPCNVKNTINALYDGADIKPKVYQERKEWGWEFKIYTTPGDCHSNIIKKANYFESATGHECVFADKGKALIMRVIEKPLGKLYDYDLDAIKRVKNSLILPLGYDIQKELHTFNLDDVYHVLIGGPTRSGKSNILNAWVYTLLNSDPKPLILLGDCKRAEFSYLKRLIQLSTYTSEVEEMLHEVETEMRRRLDLFYDAETEDYKHYNGDLRRIVVIIDELAEVKSKKAMQYIDDMLRLSACTGIHLILSTQRPSCSFLGKTAKFGDLKSNLIGRMVFAASSKIDVNMVLDEFISMKKIKGRAMWKTTDDKIMEIQAPFFDRRAVSYEQL